jgi:hypothetical protein
MEALGEDLRHNQRHQHASEKRDAGQIAPIQRHRHGVAARLAGGRQYLDDPKPRVTAGTLLNACFITSFMGYGLRLPCASGYELVDRR